MSSKYVTLQGKELSVKVNVTYIAAYAYDDEADETVIWLLGVPNAIHYPGDQRKEISMAIASA